MCLGKSNKSATVVLTVFQLLFPFHTLSNYSRDSFRLSEELWDNADNAGDAIQTDVKDGILILPGIHRIKAVAKVEYTAIMETVYWLFWHSTVILWIAGRKTVPSL